MMNRILLMIILAGLIMAPQTAQVNNYVNGNVLTADQLNSEFGNLISTINGLDEDNLLPTTQIDASLIAPSIDGQGITRQVSGALDVAPDNSTLELNADQVRVKDLGITTAKLAGSSVTAAKLAFPFQVANGSAAAPAYSFSGDTDTGMYGGAANEIGFSTGGAQRMLVRNSAVDISQNLNVAGLLLVQTGGGAAAPFLTFNGDPDTGIFRQAANTIGITTGGTQRVSIGSSGISVPSGHGIESGGGGYVKWTVFADTLGGSSSTNLSISGTVLGATGVATYNGGTVFGVMDRRGVSEVTTANESIKFDNPVSALADGLVRIVNMDAGTTNSYRVIVYYQ